MVYISDLPTSEEILKFYETYGSFKGLKASRHSWLGLRRRAFSDPHIAILRNTGGLCNQTLIEIGCSFGEFLQLARLGGAEVMGIDLDQQARAHLESIGVPNRASLPRNERADIVCAFQLMEHLENPAQLLEAISAALVNDGRLLLALPNGAEYESVGESWIGFRVDLEHFNYFSVHTLSRLLARFNLVIEQFWLHSQPDIARVANYPSDRESAMERLGGLAVRILTVGQSPSFLRQGSFVLTALARKVSAQTF